MSELVSTRDVHAEWMEAKSGHKDNAPIWVRRPTLLGDIVEGTLKRGRVELASECNLVLYDTVRSWLVRGKKELEVSDYENRDDISILAQFYLEIQQAKALFISGRLNKIIELADSGDPEYKNFQLWLAENVDEEKRFSKWVNLRSQHDENKNVKITVEYADGLRWTMGAQAREALEGEIIDTEMRQIEAPKVEDF